MQSIETVNKDPSYVSSGDPSICRLTQDDVSTASNPLRELFAGVLSLGRWLRSGLANLCCCFFPNHPTIDDLVGLAVERRSGRERQIIETALAEVEAEFTAPMELQPGFKFQRQLLIPGSKICKSISATSNPARDIYAGWKYEIHENHESIAAFLLRFFRYLRMAFGLHW